MEVEARVSVQAMRGRFEQLHEDNPLANSPAPIINTSPVRSRTASVRDTPKSSDGTKSQKKLVHPTEVGEHSYTPLTTGVNNGSTKDPNNESCLSEIISPLLPSSKTVKALSHRKHSIDSQAGKRNHSEIRTHGSILNKSAGDKLDTCGTHVKPSVVRRIPVFKSVDTGLNSQDKKFSKEKDKEDEDEPITEFHEKRGRFFGHIRSRSHGNFIIKRDSSVEKKGDSNIKQKESTSILNKDWLIQKKKPKSNDSLFNNQDSKSNSTFEGKQKIVANVVRNMKNKEKPKVFRKLSFSSKIEKEIKNKKEKSVTPRSKVKKIGLLHPSPDKADNFQIKSETNAKDFKIDGEYKVLVDSKRSSNVQNTSPLSGAAVATVSIAKAVADVALKKSVAVTSAAVNSTASPSSGDTLVIPPARPPRRRSSGAGLTPHKKGKAPAPPGQSSGSPISLNQTVSDKSPAKSCSIDEILHSSGVSGTELSMEHRLSPDVIAHRYTESPDLGKSSESLLSSQSLEKTRENSPIMINQDNSPSLRKRPVIGHSPIPGPMNNQKYNFNEEEITEFKYELQLIQLETNKERDISAEDHRPDRKGRITSKSTECLSEKVTRDAMLEMSENTKPECIPVGPPPRKPPRTFAYDIYRNVKTSKGEVVKGEKETGEMNENSQSETPSPQPIYAVPLKKKKNNTKITPKPPIRSKSDLTDQDISKPSIAPKPVHIITKAKRASVVDPLSSTEKDEEAAITSEFQRQAHIRYSLRRPKKPPPAPPPCTDIDATNHCVNSPCIPDATTHVHINRRSSLNDQINHRSFKNAWDVNSNHKQMHDENSPPDSLHLRTSHFKSLSSSQSISANDYEDIKSLIPAIRATSTYNLEATSASLETDQPLSLGYCCVDITSSDVTHLYRQRSMSDETLYKGSRRGDEPIYATPMFTSKGSSNHNHQRELHYMEADAGRDGSECGRRHRRNSTHGKEKMLGNDVADGNRARSGLISAWKRDFRQSCRQVQNKIKKTVIR